MRRTWRWGLGTAVATVLGLAGAAVALAAASGAYSGQTSQKQAVSFRLSSTKVSNFKILILDKCPGVLTLRSTETFVSIPIAKGKFGGRFVPTANRHRGQVTTLHGTVGHTKVTGTIQDASWSKTERRLCRGSATFSAKRTAKHR